MNGQNLVRDQKEKWHFDVYKDFVMNSDLSFHARMLYIVIQSFASGKSPNPFPGMNRLSQNLHLSENTILKYRQELEQKGWLKTELIRTPGQQTSHNLYTLLDGGERTPQILRAQILRCKNPQRGRESAPRSSPAYAFKGINGSPVFKLSRCIIEYANFSRLREYHILAKLGPDKIRYKPGGQPGGWTSTQLKVWEGAWKEFIKTHPPAQVESVLSFYWKNYDWLRSQDQPVPECQTFLVVLKRFDWIQGAVRREQRRRVDDGIEEEKSIYDQEPEPETLQKPLKRMTPEEYRAWEESIDGPGC